MKTEYLKKFSTEECMREVSIIAAKTYIDQLDLNYIVEKICAENYPLPRWTRADAEICAKLYKNFLYLKKKHASEPLVPTREIDEFWHNHILHTQQYFHDCLNIFGFYLHHAPEDPKDDPSVLVNQYVKTKELYFEEFRQPLKLIINQ